MKHIAIILFSLIISCTDPSASLTPFQRKAIEASVEGWRQKGLPTNFHDCEWNKASIYKTKDMDDLAHHCGVASNKKTWSCINRDTSNFGGKEYPVIVLAPYTNIDEMGEPLIHEMQHFLFDCTELDGWNDARNFQHTDPRVWTAAESISGDSSQSRARAIMNH